MHQNCHSTAKFKKVPPLHIPPIGRGHPISHPPLLAHPFSAPRPMLQGTPGP